MYLTAVYRCGKWSRGKKRQRAYICGIILFLNKGLLSTNQAMEKKIKSALISVFYKDGLEPLARQLVAQNVTIYSTGGTQKFLEDLGITCVAVESLTTYPSI